jgi:uncharacterized SAM-binding protein YcdF (DUF218 family)
VRLIARVALVVVGVVRARGVPAIDVVEAGGNDSWANLTDASHVLQARRITRVLLVTDAFHEDRSLAIATDVGLMASPVPAATSPISGWSAVPFFAKETFGVAVGPIIGYEPLHGLEAKAS